MMRRLLFALAAAGGCAAMAAQPGVGEPVVVMRHDSTEAYSVVYRIPAITAVAAGPHAGRLIAVGDYRYCGADVGFGRIDLYNAHSDDLGASWSSPGHFLGSVGQNAAQGTGEGSFDTSLQHPDAGFGDAAIVSDRTSGELLMMSVCGFTPYGRATRSNPNQIARWYSTDGGDTWTHFQNITEQIYSLFDDTTPWGRIDSMFFGSGRICQSRVVKTGRYYRLYAVMTGRNAETGATANWVLFSDDFGHTWHILGNPMTPPVDHLADEPKAEELPDGSVLLAARGQWGGRNFNIWRYEGDPAEARGRWGEAVNTNCGMDFKVNACNGEVMVVRGRRTSDGADCYVLLQSMPFATDRRNVGIAWRVLPADLSTLTPADLTLWDGHYQVSELPSAYSTMTQLPDGSIGFFYEESTFGRDYCLVYRRLPLSAITDGAIEN
jgi:sialidase-1